MHIFLQISLPSNMPSSLPASKGAYIFSWVLSENKGMQGLSDILFTLIYHHCVRSVNIFHMLAKAIPPFQHLQDLSIQPFKLGLINYFWRKSNKDSSRTLHTPIPPLSHYLLQLYSQRQTHHGVHTRCNSETLGSKTLLQKWKSNIFIFLGYLTFACQGQSGLQHWRWAIPSPCILYQERVLGQQLHLGRTHPTHPEHGQVGAAEPLMFT